MPEWLAPEGVSESSKHFLKCLDPKRPETEQSCLLTPSRLYPRAQHKDNVLLKREELNSLSSRFAGCNLAYFFEPIHTCGLKGRKQTRVEPATMLFLVSTWQPGCPSVFFIISFLRRHLVAPAGCTPSWKPRREMMYALGERWCGRRWMQGLFWAGLLGGAHRSLF